MQKYSYATALSNKKTPQGQPIPGRENDQTKNSADGYVFSITPFQRLERLLVIGSDSATYYASAQKLTKENAENLRVCLKEDGKKTVNMIVDISVAGRAPNNDPAIFALAVASTPAFGSQETAQYALAQLTKVCRTGTHLLHFADYLNSMRGWGRSVKTAFSDWYTSKNERQLAYQLVKYQQRDGWSTKDVLTLAHTKTNDTNKAALLAWAVAGGLDNLKIAADTWDRTPAKRSREEAKLSSTEVERRRYNFRRAFDLLTANSSKLISAYEAAKKATTASEIVKLIRDSGLTHEMLPTQFKTAPEVWDALLQTMPLTAMVRNLGNMTKVGLLKPLSEAAHLVVSRLNDTLYVKESMIHPLQVLLARGTYGAGHGHLGSGVWTPVPTIVDALERTFYSAFNNVTPTGKAIYIGLDISGSMSCNVINKTNLTAAQAGAAMAMVVARTEKNYAMFAFNHTMTPLNITASDSLEAAMKKTGDWTWGGTDCAQPMIHALKNGISADAFLTITDNETWAGEIHPSQALRKYRAQHGSTVKNIVMGMTATGFTINDPQDPDGLDIVGFDANVPALIGDFIRGSSGPETIKASE